MKYLDKDLENAVSKVYGKESLKEVSDSQLSILSYTVDYNKVSNGNIYREVYKNEKLHASYLYQKK